jgi:hypothetical protein
MADNQDYLFGKKESVLCKCEKCGRLQGSHTLLPLSTLPPPPNWPMEPKMPLGVCFICKEGFCVAR